MDNTMKPMTLRSKRIWIPAAAIAAAAGVALTAGVAAPQDSRIASLAPADAETLVVAPATGEWWDRVAPLMQPSTRIDGLDPEQAGAELEYIGYSKSVNHAQAGEPHYQSLRMFYVEASDEAGAKATAEWLSNADGFESRKVEVSGDVVIVSNGAGGTFELPDRSVASLIDDDVTPKSASAVMFKSPGAEGHALTGSSDSQGAQAVNEVYAKGLGLEPGTTWLGTSKDGETWEGPYRTGGASAERLDLTGLAKNLDEYAVPVFEAESTSTYYQVFLSSPADIASSAFIASPHQKSTFGGMPQTGFLEPGLASDEVSTMNTLPKQIATAAGEMQGEDENLQTVGVSAGEKQMVITLGFNGENR